MAHLTMESVAEDAGLSKGGVLYNYPSKDALVRGMVERLIEQTEAEMARLAAADQNPRGRLLRAYLHVTFPEHDPAAKRACQVAAVLLTAILTNPILLEPIRAHFSDVMQRMVKEGIDLETAHIVRLAADGLWLSEMLQVPGPAGEERSAVIRRLYELAGE